MKKISDIDINDKRVIIRCDLNVPIKDSKILDDTRIIKSLKTIKYVMERASKVIILSHLGRIKTMEDKINNSLKIVCDYLSILLNEEVGFFDYASAFPDNRIVLFENTRFFDLDNNKESNCDTELSKYFASFGDVFINDAFGTCHRENASNVGISKILPSVNGFLIEEEINNLNIIMDKPEKPFIMIMGGSKVSDKIGVIENLIKKVDKLLIGGGMAYTFLKAKDIKIGKSIFEEEYLDYAKKLLKKYEDKIILPVDNYTEKNYGKAYLRNSDITNDDVCLDIGNETVSIFSKEIMSAKTIFFNGPLGVFENGFDYGTKEICEALKNSSALVLVGGGDTINAVNKYVSDNRFIISTGGGSSLQYLEGKELVGVIK